MLSNDADDLGRLTVAAGERHDAGIRFERMQRLLHGGFNHGARRARLTERCRQLGDPIRLPCRLLRHASQIAIASKDAVGPFRQQAEAEPPGDVAEIGEAEKRAGNHDEIVDRGGGEDQRENARARTAIPRAHRDAHGKERH